MSTILSWGGIEVKFIWGDIPNHAIRPQKRMTVVKAIYWPKSKSGKYYNLSF